LTKTLGVKVSDTDFEVFFRKCVNRRLTRSQVLRRLIQGYNSERIRVEVNESQDGEVRDDERCGP